MKFPTNKCAEIKFYPFQYMLYLLTESWSNLVLLPSFLNYLFEVMAMEETAACLKHIPDLTEHLNLTRFCLPRGTITD